MASRGDVPQEGVVTIKVSFIPPAGCKRLPRYPTGDTCTCCGQPVHGVLVGALKVIPDGGRCIECDNAKCGKEEVGHGE